MFPKTFYTISRLIVGSERGFSGGVRRAGAWILAGLAAALAFPTDAFAVGVFARQTGYSCSKCHTIPPRLTWFGTQFKMQGYTLATEERPTVSLDNGSIFESLPISGRLQGTPYQKETSRVETVNPLDVVNLYVGGRVMEHMGLFTQVNFRPQGDVTTSWFRAAYARPLNGNVLVGVNGGKTSATGSDPFDSLQRMMGFPNDRNILIGGTGAAGSNLLNISDAGRGATAYAMFHDALYVGVGSYDSERRISGPAPRDLFLRTVFRVPSDSYYTHIGFFNYRSDDRNIAGGGLTGTTRGTRWGIDGSAQVPLPRAWLWDVIGFYLRGEDEAQPGGRTPVDVNHDGFHLGTALVYNSRFSFGVGYGRYGYDDTNPFGGAAVAGRTNSSLNFNLTYMVRSNARFSFDVTKRNRAALDTTVARISYDITF